MTLALIVWLVMTVFPAMKIVAIATFVALLAATFGSCLMAGIEKNFTPLNYLRSKLKWIILIILVGLLVPTQKTSWYMIGAYATQSVVQSESAQELAGDGVDVLKSLMKKAKTYIDEDDKKLEKKTP